MSKCPLLLTLAALLTALLMAVGCSSRPSAGMGVLATADSLMESRPDSALRLLRTVDPSELRRGEESARYALLMSMALDKNYIDTTTFDILRPAIDYYLRKGTPDERLRTLYYQGRIYENGANYDKALSTLNQAAATSGYSDSLTMARALFAQGNIYKNYYDINSALESFLEAGKIYNHINRKYLEFDCLLNALNNSIIIRDKQTTDSLVEVCQQFQTLDYDMYCRLQGYLLSYYVNMRDIQELRKFLLRENEHIGYDMDDIVMLASAYNRLGENQKALQLLDSVKKSGKKYDPMKYLATAVFVNRDLGDFKTAFTTYWDFSCKNESLDVKRLDQRTKLIAEKHRVELQSQEYYRQKTFLFWGASGES